MAISLTKGQKISLSKERSGLSKVIVGLGWDEAKKPKKGFLASLFGGGDEGGDVDCDAFAIMLQDGHLKSEGSTDIVYFRNLHHKSGAVRHMGDNLTGAGDGDDEQIEINLAKVPKNYDRIVIGVSIYQARNRKQHFGMIANAFIRVVDASSGVEICNYRIAENYEGMYALIFGELYVDNNEWKFGAIGEATQDDTISDVAKRFR